MFRLREERHCRRNVFGCSLWEMKHTAASRHHNLDPVIGELLKLAKAPLRGAKKVGKPHSTFIIGFFTFFSCRHFADINNKATDEIWYKRAVDYHKVNRNAFVYSIPFDVGDKKNAMVTATHAIMVGRGAQETPAAVAGMQIDYEVFRNMFFKETTTVSVPIFIRRATKTNLKHLFTHTKSKHETFFKK